MKFATPFALILLGLPGSGDTASGPQPRPPKEYQALAWPVGQPGPSASSRLESEFQELIAEVIWPSLQWWGLHELPDELIDWIKSLQYTGEGLPSFGAVKIHHTPGHIAPDQAAYFRVVPYNSNLGLLGLLRTPGVGGRLITERWIDWYLSHLDLVGVPPGVVYDHWYLADGTGETTCPPGIAPALCDYDDASDSYAATFLGVVWAYYQAGGSAAFLSAAGNKQKFETIAEVILALQQPDGLTWARDDWHVKYLMDNSEVFWGLWSMARLEAEVFGDPAAAQRYQDAAEQVRNGIFDSLYNPGTSLYRVAKHADGTYVEADLNVWYPGTVALVWPHLLGVTEGDAPMAQAQMDALNESWDGSPNDDWTSQVVDPTGFLWPSIGQAALLAGDGDRAAAHAAFVRGLTFPTFDGLFTVDDGGWLLMTLIAVEGEP